MTAVLGRADVLEILAGLHSRPVEDIPERIDSMELAWLVHQVEQRYDLRIELSDGQLGRMARSWPWFPFSRCRTHCSTPGWRCCAGGCADILCRAPMAGTSTTSSWRLVSARAAR